VSTAPVSEIVRAMVCLQNQSGQSRDQVVNTFHFHCATLDDAAVTALTAKIVNFYNTGHASSTTVASLISPAIARTPTATQIKYYDLGDGKPRQVHADTFFLGSAGSTTGMPNEVAACLSYYSNRNVRRQRGRIFIGPLGTGVNGWNDRDSYIVVSNRQVITSAAEALAENVSDGRVWGVYSPTAQLLYYPMTNGWVDETFDTIRKRGVRPTARTDWAAS
jgi:hypothetical protein